ncbi:MAG: histone deacetylase family protein [Candidatus Geothermincolia bacterium]
MAEVVIYFDPLFEEHKTGYGHPERPERLPIAMNALADSGLLEDIEVISPRDATVAEIELVHSPKYVEQVMKVSEAGGGHLDMDTAVSEATYPAALKAAGALLESVDWCLAGESRRTFCMVRPPGHHALPSRGMGFCIFNNVAVGARYAIARKGLKRVMIVDWDAHHGNGTQDTFYEDDNVLYASIHQYPHYPGTGWVDETGKGKGEGLTLNFPFPAGTGEDSYLDALERVIIPAGKRFKPDLVMVSAGYDSHAGDLLCSMRLIDSSYRKMTDMLVGFSEDYCSGRLIVTLEGGYNLNAQARSIVQTVAGLAGVDIPGKDEPAQPTSYPDRARDVIEQVARQAGLG